MTINDSTQLGDDSALSIQQLDLLSEIVKRSEKESVDPTLYDVLRHYNHVVEERKLSPRDGHILYAAIIRISRYPGSDWNVKLNIDRQQNLKYQDLHPVPERISSVSIIPIKDHQCSPAVEGLPIAKWFDGNANSGCAGPSSTEPVSRNRPDPEPQCQDRVESEVEKYFREWHRVVQEAKSELTEQRRIATKLIEADTFLKSSLQRRLFHCWRSYSDTITSISNQLVKRRTLQRWQRKRKLIVDERRGLSLALNHWCERQLLKAFYGWRHWTTRKLMVMKQVRSLILSRIFTFWRRVSLYQSTWRNFALKSSSLRKQAFLHKWRSRTGTQIRWRLARNRTQESMYRRYLKMWKIAYAQSQMAALFRYRQILKQTVRVWRLFVNSRLKIHDREEKLVRRIHTRIVNEALIAWRYQYRIRDGLQRCDSVCKRVQSRLALSALQFSVQLQRVQSESIHCAHEQFQRFRLRRSLSFLLSYTKFHRLHHVQERMKLLRMRLSVCSWMQITQHSKKIKRVTLLFHSQRNEKRLYSAINRWFHSAWERRGRRRHIQLCAEEFLKFQALNGLRIWFQWVVRRQNYRLSLASADSIAILSMQRRVFQAFRMVRIDLDRREICLSSRIRVRSLMNSFCEWRLNFRLSRCVYTTRRRCLLIRAHQTVCKWRDVCRRSARVHRIEAQINLVHLRMLMTFWRCALYRYRAVTIIIHIRTRQSYRNVIEIWKHYTQHCQRLSTICSSIIQSRRNRLLPQYLRLWMNRWTSLLGIRRLLTVSNAIVVRFQKWIGLKSWRTALCILQQQHLKLYLISCRQRLPILRQCIAVWWKLTSILRNRRRYLKAVSFREWRDSTMTMLVCSSFYRKRRLQIGMKALRSLKQRRLHQNGLQQKVVQFRLRTLFGAWRELYLELADLKSKMVSFHVQLLRRLFNRWRRFNRRMSVFRTCTSQQISVNQQRCYRYCFQIWRDAYFREKMLQNCMLRAECFHRLQSLSRSLQCLRNYTTRRLTISRCSAQFCQRSALKKWTCYVQRQRELSQAVSNLHSFQQRLQLKAALRQLNQHVVIHRWYRDQFQISDLFIQSNCFRYWYQCSPSALSTHQHAASISEIRRRFRMRRFLNFWRCAFQNRLCLKQTAHRLLRAFLQPDLRSGFNSWLQYSQWALSCTAVEKNVERCLIRFSFVIWRQSLSLLRFCRRRKRRHLSSALYQAFHVWHLHSNRRAQRRFQIQQLCSTRIRALLKSQLISATFSSWRHFVISRTFRRKNAIWFTERVRKCSKLRVCFTVWRQLLQLCRKYRINVYARFFRRVRMSLHYRKKVDRFRLEKNRCNAVRALHSWGTLLRLKQRRRDSIRSFTGRSSCRARRRVLREWARACRLRIWHRSLENRRRQSGARFALQRLSRSAQIAIRNRVEVAAFHDRLTKAFPDMIVFNTSKEIAPFQDTCDGKALSLTLYHQIGDFLSDSIKQSAGYHCLLKWRTRDERMVFYCWKQNVSDRLLLKRHIQDATLFHQQQQRLAAISRWRCYVERCRHDRISFDLWKISIRERCWQRWVIVFTTIRIELAQQHKAERFLKLCFVKRWRARYHQQYYLRCRYNLLSANIRRLRSRSTLQYWHSKAFFYRDNRIVIEREHFIRPMFSRWLSNYLYCKQRIIMLHEVLEQTRISVQQVCFRRWKVNVRSCRDRRQLIDRFRAHYLAIEIQKRLQSWRIWAHNRRARKLSFHQLYSLFVKRRVISLWARLYQNSRRWRSVLLKSESFRSRIVLGSLSDSLQYWRRQTHCIVRCRYLQVSFRARHAVSIWRSITKRKRNLSRAGHGLTSTLVTRRHRTILFRWRSALLQHRSDIHSILSNLFRAWSAFTKHERCLRSVSAIVQSRWCVQEQNRSSSKMLRLWYRLLCCNRNERVVCDRHVIVERHRLLRHYALVLIRHHRLQMLNRNMARRSSRFIFQFWRLCLRKRHGVRLIVSLSNLSHLRLSLKGWISTTRGLKHLPSRLRHWLHEWLYALHHVRNCKHVESRIVMIVQRRYLQEWRSALDRERSISRETGRLILKRYLSLLTSMFHQWYQITRASIFHKRIIMHRCFLDWSIEARLRCLQRKLLRTLFQGWRCVIEDVKRSLANIYIRRRYRLIFESLSVWTEQYQNRSRYRHFVVRICSVYSTLAIRVGFHSIRFHGYYQRFNSFVISAIRRSSLRCHLVGMWTVYKSRCLTRRIGDGKRKQAIRILRQHSILSKSYRATERTVLLLHCTNSLRRCFGVWRDISQQILAQRQSQLNLCRNCFTIWKELVERSKVEQLRMEILAQEIHVIRRGRHFRAWSQLLHHTSHWQKCIRRRFWTTWYQIYQWYFACRMSNVFLAVSYFQRWRLSFNNRHHLDYLALDFAERAFQSRIVSCIREWNKLTVRSMEMMALASRFFNQRQLQNSVRALRANVQHNQEMALVQIQQSDTFHRMCLLKKIARSWATYSRAQVAWRNRSEVARYVIEHRCKPYFVGWRLLVVYQQMSYRFYISLMAKRMITIVRQWAVLAVESQELHICLKWRRLRLLGLSLSKWNSRTRFQRFQKHDRYGSSEDDHDEGLKLWPHPPASR